MDKIAKHNKVSKYFLFSVNVLSQYFRVQTLKTTSAENFVGAFKKILMTKEPGNV